MTIREQVELNFPTLNETELLDDISASARLFHNEKVQAIVGAGDFPKWIPLVTRGAIKVSRLDEEGNEIFLYYLYPGQTCAMTLNCCMTERPSEIRAEAEAGTEYVGVPRVKLAEWMVKFESWRNFTLQTYDERYLNLLATIDAIAFQRLDERLLQLLEDKSIAQGSPSMNITHKGLAEELHSSREVISRLLKQLEKRGKVTLRRNSVELL